VIALLEVLVRWMHVQDLGRGAKVGAGQENLQLTKMEACNAWYNGHVATALLSMLGAHSLSGGVTAV